MATRLDEQRWRERSHKLEKDRNIRNRKKPGVKTGTNDVLKKARALDKIRKGEAKSPLSKYEVVPPVKPKLHAFERSSSDDDSWGEGSEMSDDDYYLERPKPAKQNQQPYPLPPMNFALVPVQHPGFLAPEQQPDKRQKKKKDYLKRKSKPTRSMEVKSVSHETQTEDDLPAQTRASYYSPSQRFREPLQRDPRYPYIHLTPNGPEHANNHRLLKEAALKFYDDPRFSTNYVNDFVDSQLRDEIIPDVFIEVLDEMHRQRNPPIEPANDQNRYRPFQLHPYPPDARPLPVGPQVQSLVSQADASKDIVDDLVEQFLRTQVAAVVRETCSDYVHSYVQKSHPEDVVDKLTDALIAETCQSMFEEVKTDVMLEEFIDKHVIEPVVDDLTIDVATETLEQQDKKLKAEGHKELSGNAQTKFLDGVLLDNMLEQIIKQERVHVNESPIAQFTIDEMALEIMLQKMVEIDYCISEPMNVKPLKRYHEQVVTDVVMDLLLNELCLSLDDDMRDFDEYEMGLTDCLYENGDYET